MTNTAVIYGDSLYDLCAEEIEQFEDSCKKEFAEMSGISFDGQKVLLVEDNEMNREIAIELLEEEGTKTPHRRKKS